MQTLMKKKTFNDRLHDIWNTLDLDKYNYFTLNYYDKLLEYFLDKKDNLTYDDLEYKLSEIKSLISIINPTFKDDIKIFNKLINVLNKWKIQIDKLDRIKNL